MEMVMGFMFSPDMSMVSLLKKRNGPSGASGKWVGPGGKLNDGETPSEAMSREFHEEAGVMVSPRFWRPFAVVNGTDWRVHLFETRSSWYSHARTMTDEPVQLFSVSDLPPGLSNMTSWGIPMALDFGISDPVVINTRFDS